MWLHHFYFQSRTSTTCTVCYDKFCLAVWRLTHHSCVSSPPAPLCVRWASSCWKPELSAGTWPPQPNPSAGQSDPRDPETESLPAHTNKNFNVKFILKILSKDFSLWCTDQGSVPGIFFVNSTRTWTWLVAISVSRRKFSSVLYWSWSCKHQFVVRAASKVLLREAF